MTGFGVGVAGCPVEAGSGASQRAVVPNSNDR